MMQAQSDVPFTPLWIDGKKRAASTNATYEVRNPANGSLVNVSASASIQDCVDAIQAADKTFASWKSVSPGVKAKIFRTAAQLLASDKYSAHVVKSVVEETGAPASWARIVNVDFPSEFFLEGADAAYSIKGEILPSDYGAQSFVEKRPMGVIFIISPWNAPLGLCVMTALPAIAAGNAVVLKTSESSPRSQLSFAEILKEAGLPDGVLNIIHTSREDSPPRVAEIIAHPLVRKIGFTGSDRVGKILAAEAAKYLKPIVLELGGKAPAVVLNDADIDAAARGIVAGTMAHSGQVCIATERVIVQREVSQQLVNKIKEYASKLRAGDQSTTNAKLSCLFTEAAAINVVSMVKEAVDNGAQLLLGDLHREGAFVQPHVVLGAKPGDRLWDGESFGPVMTIAIVDSVDEAVELANASTYSLSASLWTRDMRQGFEVSRRIRSSKVVVNGTTLGHESRSEHQGLGGSSGYGCFTVKSFLDTQLITFQAPDQKFLLVDF